MFRRDERAPRREPTVSSGAWPTRPAPRRGATDGLPIDSRGTLALIGGGEWGEHHQALDRRLSELSGSADVVVLPTAAAFEHPERIGAVAERHFAPLGVSTRTLPVLNRRDAEDADERRRRSRPRSSSTSPTARRCTCARCSRAPRSTRRCSPRSAAARSSPRPAPRPRCCATRWSTPAAARTRWASGSWRALAVFPYHGTAADHLLARSIDLKPPEAVLVGVDAETALVREPGPTWSVAGAGVVTIYGADGPTPYAAGAEGIDLP